MNKIGFITKTSNTIYDLELSKALLGFIEFDFSLFREQSIEIGKFSARHSSFPIERANKVKALIKHSHPYIESHINTHFGKIVIDCIIEYICQNEGISLEGLWQRCISPKNSYEKALFSRISEYKTFRAVNEWVNILRIQEYATKKAKFVFGEKTSSVSECAALCRYFDLCYSVTSQEIGVPSSQLPTVEMYNVSSAPNSPFILNRPAKSIYNKLKESLDDATPYKKIRMNDAIRDSYALDAFELIKDMKRPLDIDLFSAMTAFRDLYQVVYYPNCFKALIDLEFDKMFENNLLLSKCPSCHRYFRHTAVETDILCNRVNSKGKTCREDAKEKDGQYIPQEIGEKSEIIYNTLSKRVGSQIDEKEFGEWSDYLEGLKRNVEQQNIPLDELEAFLEYSEKMYGDLK